ncbi:hypothetical protein ABZ714_00150 [Streptomyces sp. NPDC006798]|uniref:hypothetical protein n=1 Tax=Streptomyces sp. NPDC006798 TaxID=3155462 RepID=UPI0033F8E992
MELRGTRVDCELFETAAADQGWVVLDSRGGNVPDLADTSRFYTIEVRFPGSRINAIKGARERVEVLSDSLLLDLKVLIVDRVERDPELLPQWSAYIRPTIRPYTAVLSRRDRWAERWAVWCAEHMGAQDTGRLVQASSVSAAWRLAARHLPGARTPSGQVAARGSWGVTEPPASDVPLRRRESSRMPNRGIVALVAALWVGARIADRYELGFGAWWGFALVWLGACWSLTTATRRMAPQKPRGAIVAVSLAATLFAALLGAGTVRAEPAEGVGSGLILYGALATVGLNGLRLLIRQWTWQRFAPWLIPALLALLVSLRTPPGFGLYAVYLDAFGVHTEDVQVPQAYQFLAALKLLACMSLLFAIPALLGYAKHLHLYVKERGPVNLLLFAASLAFLAIGVVGLGVGAAGRAGEEALERAKAGGAPSVYFGVEPQWVCAQPVGKVSDIPVDGGELRPERPYLRVGDSGGTMVLWDPRAKQAFKVPLDKLHVVPQETRPAFCRTKL